MESVEYFKKNIESVPTHIPVLVIANFRDRGDQWKISASEIRSLIEHYEFAPTKPPKSAASGDEETPAEEVKESAAIATESIPVGKDESNPEEVKATSLKLEEVKATSLKPEEVKATSLKPEEVKATSLETEGADVASKEKSSVQTLREEFDLQSSDRFKDVVEEFLRRPRVIKYIETSFLEKFGLHVRWREGV